MRDEKQRGPTSDPLTEPPVVESGHHRLPCPGRGDQEIAVAIVPVPLRLKLLEHARLMGLRRDVECDEAAAEVPPPGPTLAVERLP